jgi:hypothetical protein
MSKETTMLFPAIFALVVGLGMIGQWTMSFITKQIPELKSEPTRIGFHLVGEMLTALVLILSGIGLLAGWSWAPVLYLVASGMLIYTAIVSPGYFAQQGKWIWVGIFAILILLNVGSMIPIVITLSSQ